MYIWLKVLDLWVWKEWICGVDEKDGTYVVLLAINQGDAKTKQFCGRHFLFSRWI